VDISLEAFYSYIKSTQTEVTAKKYRKGAEMFLTYLHSKGFRDFSALPRNTLQLFSVSLIKEDYSAATINLYTVGVQRYLTWCADQGVNLPYLAKPESVKLSHRVRGILKRDQLADFFKACNEVLTEPTRTAIMLMPCCGLRSNEMAGLSLDSLIRVHVQQQDGTSKISQAIRVIGKGDKERYAPLLDEGREILRQYLQGWRRERTGNRLFPSIYNGENSMNPHSIWVSVRKVREALDIKELSPHTLRRTYATTLWRRGVADTTIAKILGHENLQTLYKHYLNMGVEDLTSAVQSKGGQLIGS